MNRKLLCLFLLIATDACAVSRRRSIFSRVSDWFKGVESETRTVKHPVSPQENTIDITNFNGDITVKTWNKKEILLEVTITGASEMLERVTVDIKSKKHAIHIKTLGIDPEEIDACTVDYVLVIPKECALNIQTEYGNITINNVTKPINTKTYKGCVKITGGKMIAAETKYGNIDIETTDLQKTDRILAMSTKGNVNLSVPQDTNATLYAKAVSGKVSTEQKVALKNISTEISGKALAELRKDVQGFLGNVGEGENSEIRLLTDRGNVKVQRA